MCSIEGCGCQTHILPHKSHAPGDCFKNQMMVEQTVRMDLCFLSTPQSGEPLAVLYEINPKVTVKRGEKCRRNEALWKLLEVEIVLFKVLTLALRCPCLLLEDPVPSEGSTPLGMLLPPDREVPLGSPREPTGGSGAAPTLMQLRILFS